MQSKIQSLEDWEYGLVCELRILKEAGVLDEVLNLMTSLLEILYTESEKAALEQASKKLKLRISRQAKKQNSIASAFDKTDLFKQATPERYRELIKEKTVCGRMLFTSGFSRKEILQVYYEEIAKKAKLAGINRCRSYVSGTL